MNGKLKNHFTYFSSFTSYFGCMKAINKVVLVNGCTAVKDMTV